MLVVSITWFVRKVSTTRMDSGGGLMSNGESGSGSNSAAPPQVGNELAGGGDSSGRLATTFDVLSPRMQDCWPLIFDHLSNPQSWIAVSNTCRLFNTLMKSRMGELVIPIILKTVEVGRPTVMALRRASKQSKVSVDKLLFESNPKPQWLTEPFFLWNPEIMEELGRDFAPALPGSFSSEFLTLRVQFPAQYENALALVTNHGANLRSIRLSLDVERLSVLYQRLTALLSHLPNLDTLALFFEGKAYHQESAADQLDPSILPELPLLKNLHLFFDDNYSPTNRLEALVQRYGLQLEKFRCRARAFIQMRQEIITNFLSNLLQLRVSEIFAGSRKEVFDFLAVIQLPKLEALILEGYPFEGGLLKVITNFRTSLKKLDISKLELDMKRVDLKDIKPEDLNLCPKMETLVLSPSKDIHNSPVMKVFGLMFRNLKSLTFAQRWAWIWEFENEYNSRLPFWFWRRMYYLMWPRLEKIKKKTGGGGPNRFGREKIFNRPANV